MSGILFTALKFQGFNFIVSQVAVIFPFILQAPRFLTGQLTLGGMDTDGQVLGTYKITRPFSVRPTMILQVLRRC